MIVLYFRCECLPGYSGKHCEIDDDDCVGHKCRHGAVCVDAVNGYTCVCPQGFRYVRVSSSLDCICTQCLGTSLIASILRANQPLDTVLICHPNGNGWLTASHLVAEVGLNELTGYRGLMILALKAADCLLCSAVPVYLPALGFPGKTLGNALTEIIWR